MNEMKCDYNLIEHTVCSTRNHGSCRASRFVYLNICITGFITYMILLTSVLSVIFLCASSLNLIKHKVLCAIPHIIMNYCARGHFANSHH